MTEATNAPIGFAYNDGGISNQKVALLGLAVTAAQTNTPIYLPSLYDRHQDDALSSTVPFADVFFAQDWRCFLERWGIALTTAPPIIYEDRIARGGWRFFETGAFHLAGLTHRPRFRSDIAADLVSSLAPRVTRSGLARAMRDEVFVRLGIGVVVQLRIERDWRDFSRDILSGHVTEPEDYGLDAAAICRKVRATLGATRIYATCDERHLSAPAPEIKREVAAETGVTIVFKSDLACAGELARLPPLELSLLDFDMACRARTFVGNSRSSFANLATFSREVRGIRHDFIYNRPGSRLGRRTDRGTQIVPGIVCEVSASG